MQYIFKLIALLALMNWGVLTSTATEKTATSQQNQPLHIAIPIELHPGGMWVASALLNDQIPLTLGIDLAAQNSSIRQSIVQAADLEKDEMVFNVFGLIGVENAPSVSGDLTIGALHHNGPLIVIDDTKVLPSLEIDGLAGLDLLMNGHNFRYVLVDLKNGQIEASNDLDSLGVEGRPDWKQQTPIGQDKGFLTFPARFDGIRGAAIIDTGINVLVANPYLGERLSRRKPIQEIEYRDANGQEALLRTASVQRLDAGGLVWRGSTAVVYDSPALGKIASLDQPLMIIGLAHLNNNVLIVDRHKDKIAISPDRSFSTRQCAKRMSSCMTLASH